MQPTAAGAKHWGKPESTIDEQLYDFERMKPFGPVGVANSYLQYFETFNDSLQPDVFKAYFQNADVKPHGRFFLKELVFNVAATDASRILIGAQPIGTWGRDAETQRVHPGLHGAAGRAVHASPKDRTTR